MLYLIINGYENEYYVVASNIEEAIKIYKQEMIDESEIIKIELITGKVLLGEENEQI